MDDFTPISVGAVDICSCQNFFACVYLFCLLRPKFPLSAGHLPVSRFNTVEQVILFFHFNSVTIFRGWSTKLRPQQLSEPELEDCTPISVGSVNALARNSLACVDFCFCFLEAQLAAYDSPGWALESASTNKKERWMRSWKRRFTGLHFCPPFRANARLPC